MQDSIIPPVLESRNEQIQNLDIGCDPLVIATDAEGNVYSGRDRIGSLASLSDLKTSLRELVEAKGSQIAHARGTDLNVEIPLSRCTDYSVFITSAADPNDHRTLQLIRVFQEVGIHPAEVIKGKKKL